MGKQKATNLFSRLLVIAIYIVLLAGTCQSLSDKRLCADENCKEIISLGTGKINYPAGEEGMVSFKINSPIRIKSKSAGRDLSLWGIEVNGREGYAPKELIRETKVYIRENDLKFEVDVVKPAPKVPILSTSESSVAKEETAETTTTKPLEFIPRESIDKPPPTTPTEVTKIESATTATPVMMELVDGTKIPKLDYDPDSVEKSVNDGFPVNINEKEEANDDYEDEDEDIIGDYDEEEDNNQSAVRLDESNDANLQENILPNYTEKDIKKNAVEDDAKNVITSEKVENSLNLNDNFVQEQKPATISDENETKDQKLTKSTEENEINQNDDNKEKQVFEVNRKATAEILNLNNSSAEGNEIKIHKQILGNENHDVSEESILQSNAGKENKKHAEQEDANNGITSKKVENSLNLNDNFEQYQELANISEENKTKDKNENTDKQSENEKRVEDSLSLNNSSKEGENENDKKLLDSTGNLHITEQIENHSQSNEYINKKDAKEEIAVNGLDGNNMLPAEQQPDLYILNNVTHQESVPHVEQALNDKNNSKVDVDLTTANIQGEHFNNSPSLNDALDSENEIDLIKTNDLLNENSANNPNQNNVATDSITPLENYSTVIDSSIKTEDQETVYTPTISPQIVTEEKTNEINTQTLEQEINNKKEENKPEIKQDSFITTSSNAFTEASTNVHSLSEENTINEDLYLSSLTTEVPHNSVYEQQAAYYDNSVTEHPHLNEDLAPNSDLAINSVTVGLTSAEELPSDTTLKNSNKFEEKTTKVPSNPSDHFDMKENKGLFATIMGTVNSVLTINKKGKHSENEDNHELDRILFPKMGDDKKIKAKKEDDLLYCKKIGPNGECPHQENELKPPHCECSFTDTIFNSDLTLDAFIKAMAAKILEISEILVFLVIVAAASLFFIFGYYCFCNSSREGALLSKLNQLESSLLALQKENAILKHNLMSTRQKLTSIEDNSFGSNDMVLSLKKELEEELLEKARLQDQITALQKELENAADAGIELNKIVSELLSNQTGDESIISSVEELQKQLNEQQNTILEINASLAEKSRENSELQLLLAEQNARYESELAILQRDNDELEHEKGNLLSRLEELKNDFDRDITTALEGKNIEIKRLQNEILELNNKVESEHTKWQTSLAKVEALEECLKNVRKDPSVNPTELIDVANVKAQLIEAQRKYKTFKERLDSEADSRKLAENQLQIVSAEVEKLKQDYNQSEKDKLEAQTRLEVLSNYFKEKENQLQKELSLKEAMWLKQQGETTTTVDRLTAMQEEIQSLKSQNDSLRAEIEAQVAAHKAQTGTLENRAHETWLAARQSDRRYEEARAEATALRRKLTALAGGNINEGNKPPAGPINLGEDLTNVPSPIHMESPGSPMLGRMPPPPFLPPPFLGPPPPFIGMPPPPPFVPPGEMRPAPLGRIMSPPPQRSGRFSPQHLDFEDYLDYEGNNTWHRHTYSPPPRTYRSLSPTDSRYDYGTERDLMSTYDTETDFSPPPSPRESRRRGANNTEKFDLSKDINNVKRFNSKGPLSSGSEKSYNSPSHNVTKTKKGSSSGGKSIV